MSLQLSLDNVERADGNSCGKARDGSSGGVKLCVVDVNHKALEQWQAGRADAARPGSVSHGVEGSGGRGGRSGLQRRLLHRREHVVALVGICYQLLSRLRGANRGGSGASRKVGDIMFRVTTMRCLGYRLNNPLSFV